MFVRTLRRRRRLSQEQLAESSRLSLRTIQRVEAGHRISFASLRAIARVLDTDVDQLELELYAKDKTADNFEEKPLWVRMLLGRAWASSTRRELRFTEVVLVCLGALLVGVSAANTLWSIIYDPDHSALYTGLVMFLFAYLLSVCIRIGDKHAVWLTPRPQAPYKK